MEIDLLAVSMGDIATEAVADDVTTVLERGKAKLKEFRDNHSSSHLNEINGRLKTNVLLNAYVLGQTFPLADILEHELSPLPLAKTCGSMRTVSKSEMLNILTKEGGINMSSLKQQCIT